MDAYAMTITHQLFGGKLSSWSLLILLIFLILPISSKPDHHQNQNYDHHDHEVGVDLVPSSSRSSSSKDVDFIRSRCGETLYPDLCYTSLSGYAYDVQKDPAVLTRIAIGLTLFRATRLLRYAANISISSSSLSSVPVPVPPTAAASSNHRASSDASSALHDCISVIGDAVDQIRGSLKQMRRLMNMTSAGNHDQSTTLRIGLSDVQTWMSAALTNEDTCTEGLEEEMGDDQYNNNNWDIEDLSYRATKVKRVTSNALALLNGYVANLSLSSSSSSPSPPSPNNN